MAHGMAPPHKKRRLSPDAAPTTCTAARPTSTFAHSVESIEDRNLWTAQARPRPHHVQEVHLQIQHRPAFPAIWEEHRGLHRRQEGLATVVNVITTVDAAGSTILSTVTNLSPVPITTASTTASSTISTSNTSDGFIGSGTGTTTSTSTNSSSDTTSTQSGSTSGSSQTASGLVFTSGHSKSRSL